MKTKAWLGIGVAIGVIIIALSLAFTVVPKVGKVIEAPVKLAEIVVDKLSGTIGTWGQQKITVNSYSDRLEVKPIAELALARLRTRSIVDYQHSHFSSSKRVIAHQAFDLRVGLDLKSGIDVLVNNEERLVEIKIKNLTLLTISPVEANPVILYRDEGAWNKLSPEDVFSIQERLKQEALSSPEMEEAFSVAKQSTESFFSGIFGLSGYRTSFVYENEKRG